MRHSFGELDPPFGQFGGGHKIAQKQSNRADVMVDRALAAIRSNSSAISRAARRGRGVIAMPDGSHEPCGSCNVGGFVIKQTKNRRVRLCGAASCSVNQPVCPHI